MPEVCDPEETAPPHPALNASLSHFRADVLRLGDFTEPHVISNYAADTGLPTCHLVPQDSHPSLTIPLLNTKKQKSTSHIQLPPTAVIITKQDLSLVAEHREEINTLNKDLPRYAEHTQVYEKPFTWFLLFPFHQRLADVHHGADCWLRTFWKPTSILPLLCALSSAMYIRFHRVLTRTPVCK